MDMGPYLEMLGKVVRNTAGVRRPGAAALDLCYVAAGRLDGFWEIGLKSWDMAAGSLIIREAGGIVSALHACPEADAVAVLSCDLVAPSSAEIQRLLTGLGGHDVVVPVVHDRPQWTHAIWSRRAVKTLERAFIAGDRAPRDAVGELSVRRVAVDDAASTAYADADTPDDLPDQTAT